MAARRWVFLQIRPGRKELPELCTHTAACWHAAGFDLCFQCAETSLSPFCGPFCVCLCLQQVSSPLYTHKNALKELYTPAESSPETRAHHLTSPQDNGGPGGKETQTCAGKIFSFYIMSRKFKDTLHVLDLPKARCSRAVKSGDMAVILTFTHND